MKIKIALLGLFFANGTIDPIYADRYGCQLEELDGSPKIEVDEDEDKSEDLIKIGAELKMSPSVIYQDSVFSTKNGLTAKLTFKGDVPKAWCNKNAKVKIGAGWDGKNFKVKNAAVTIGKMVTMGYSSTIFAYEKAGDAVLISPDATVLQIKHEYAVDWFRVGYAIERPVALQVGLFDKSKLELVKDDPTNRVDKDEKGPFTMKNSVPAVGLNIGAVTDRLNLVLSGLFRSIDYTHSASKDSPSKEKNSDTHWALSGGGHLGIQYQVVPKKFTVTGQGVYVHGLGDYVSGLAAIQGNTEREEMCAAYYLDKDKSNLSNIQAFGFGGALEYAVTTKWTLSVGGSWFRTVDNKDKPDPAFRMQWNVAPGIAYEVNKYFTLSGGYSFVQEYRINEKQNKGSESKVSGGIKFSL